jgi:hypothetical protein
MFALALPKVEKLVQQCGSIFAGRTIRFASAITFISLSSGCAGDIVPAPDKLAPWTAILREQQPEDAFAAFFHHHKNRLIVIGAHHSTDANGATFRLIDQIFSNFKTQVVIAEGGVHSKGPNDPRLLDYVASHKEVDGFQSGGETVPVVRNALAQGAVIWGGEPDDAEILRRLRAVGISDADVLGFYTLRSIPQWVRERKITSAADSTLGPLIEKDLGSNRKRLALPPNLIVNCDEWLQWYLQINKRKSVAEFETEEVAPLADGAYPTNRIASAIGRARDGFLLELIAHHLNAKSDVIVVFGGSHLMILRPALEAMVGPACYIGDNIETALARCGS